MLDEFRVAHYVIEIVAREELLLPEYKGSMLRGAFGHTLRRLCCAQRQETCKECLVRENCPYFYVFETAPGQDAEVLRKNESVPRPFVLEPPLTRRTRFEKGESLFFNLILIGRAISLLPYFIVTLRELGDWGIGTGQGKYHLAGIRARHPLSGEEAVVYQGDGLVRNVDRSLGFGELSVVPAPTGTTLTVNFLTMTRLKHQGHLIDIPEFEAVIHNILRRLSAMAYFHCGERLRLDFKGLTEDASRVRLVDHDTRWVDWERFSSRQQVKMKMGGIVGTAAYLAPEEGYYSRFWPWLKLGEMLHIGKNTVFGLGKIRIS